MRDLPAEFAARRRCRAVAEPERALPHDPGRACPSPRRGDGASPYERLPISALVEAAGEPHLSPEIAVQYDVEASRGPDGKPLEEPLVRRSPEIMHGLNNLIQNAMQFARTRSA